MSYFQAVLDGYSLFHNPEYVEDRLKAGVIFGAFVDGRLAGFVGEHHEGSMGMLEVFPPYRGHGLGLALESFQINRYLSQGRVPFDQVIVGNEKSMSLQKKVGMELSKDTMSWLHRKKNPTQPGSMPDGSLRAEAYLEGEMHTAKITPENLPGSCTDAAGTLRGRYGGAVGAL